MHENVFLNPINLGMFWDKNIYHQRLSKVIYLRGKECEKLVFVLNYTNQLAGMQGCESIFE